MNIEDIKKLVINPGDIVLINLGCDVSPSLVKSQCEAIEALLRSIAERGIDFHYIIHCGLDLQSIPESEMEKAGWIRKP